MDAKETAKKIIEENIYCTIATSSLEGKPWISPVFFAYDDRYNIYWVSNKDALHSQNIKLNPSIAIVFFNSKAPEGEGDGVYFEANAQELSHDTEIDQAIMLFNSRVTKDEFRIKNKDKVTNSGVWRIYKATPIMISKLTEGEEKNGQYIDKREEINL